MSGWHNVDQFLMMSVQIKQECRSGKIFALPYLHKLCTVVEFRKKNVKIQPFLNDSPKLFYFFVFLRICSASKVLQKTFGHFLFFSYVSQYI